MPFPAELGQPCWTPEQVRKVISLTAQTSSKSATAFLAAHSPFPRISDFKNPGRHLDEEGVFQDIFSPSRSEVQAFVKGEPGTGKSHLIRWLKLRADYAALHKERGLHEFKLVLVERGNGSLKDALGQIVQQLGGEFKKHIDPVKGAIERLSDGTARAKLLSELALEIDNRWTAERSRDALPKSLRHLGQSLKAAGVGAWMLRDEGVVAQVIQRLTQHSSVQDREHFPEFTAADFKVPPKYLRPDENSRQVIEFIEDLREDNQLANAAAKTLNTARQDAIGELTGLRGSDLLEIFREIRKALFRQHKSLGIFIEDVSVTGLDQDVINAFEPRAGDDLCHMFAVLGVTNAGWGSSSMADNQKQRGTHVFEVGGDVVSQWANDDQQVARFAARYLNTLRLSESEIATVAKERFKGDIRLSKCDGCQHQEPCHAAFGKVDLAGGVTIGMFPFSERAPQALLARLTDNYYRSQRGLLDRVLLPALDQSHSAFADREFPRAENFSVQQRPISYWAGFEQKFCGGGQWTSEKKARLKFLAQFWASAQSAEELATQLQPLLKPLGLPPFLIGAKPQTIRTPEPTAPAPAQPQRQTEDPELLRLQECLDVWLEGKPLKQDDKYRNYLGRFLKVSIPWQDQRGTPITEVKRLVSGQAFPRIEDQTAKPHNQIYFVDFKRNQESYSLLQSLNLFERRGQGSWDFEHGELHKRTLSRWLRKNRDRVVDSIRPQPASLTGAAVRCAIQVTALAATWRDRKQFSDPGPESLKRLLAAIWEEDSKPEALSRDVKELTQDLQHKHQGLCDFLVRELGVGQGEADPKDFIDPVPILRTLEEYQKDIEVTPPPNTVEKSFWAPRFEAVAKFGAYGTLKERLGKERKAIRDLIDTVGAFVRDCGCSGSDERTALKSCLEQIIEVVELQYGKQHRRAVLPMPNPPFDELWKQKLIQQRGESWGSALVEGLKVSEADKDMKLLVFDSGPLSQLLQVVTIVRDHLELVQDQMKEEEDELEKSGAGSGKELLEELGKIVGLSDPLSEKESERGS